MSSHARRVAATSERLREGEHRLHVAARSDRGEHDAHATHGTSAQIAAGPIAWCIVDAMAIQGLLRLGIRTAIAQSGEELEELVLAVGLPREAADHVREALMAMPGLLVAIDRALETQGQRDRLALWRSLASYLLTDDDLVPTDEGKPIRGVLDDAYFVHRAAQVMRRDLPGVELHDLDGGADLLASILPGSITDPLDARVRAMTSELPR